VTGLLATIPRRRVTTTLIAGILAFALVGCPHRIIGEETMTGIAHARFFVVVGACLLSPAMTLGACRSGPAEQSEIAEIAAVESGDVVRLEDGRRIRLLGVDAPDGEQCHALVSKRLLERLLPPETAVRLGASAGGNPEEPGRVFHRFIFVRGANMSLGLVERGAVTAYFRPEPGRRWRRELREAAQRAHEANVGAWGACSGTLDPSYPWRLERRAPDLIERRG
jgi:endonuclease YncB( thermonuclease family)